MVTIKIPSDCTCFNCKYLELQPITDNWLQVGKVEYYCNNVNAMDIPDYLDEDCMEDYADKCGCFELLAGDSPEYSDENDESIQQNQC